MYDMCVCVFWVCKLLYMSTHQHASWFILLSVGLCTVCLCRSMHLSGQWCKYRWQLHPCTCKQSTLPLYWAWHVLSMTLVSVCISNKDPSSGLRPMLMSLRCDEVPPSRWNCIIDVHNAPNEINGVYVCGITCTWGRRRRRNRKALLYEG